VSPVEAQATAGTRFPRRIISFTTETSTVMPRSLKLPVWVLPHCFTHRSSTPSCWPRRFAQNRLVWPSNMETTFSSATTGQTSSRLPHTPEPYGHSVVCARDSKIFIHFCGGMRFSRSRSCCTVSSPPQYGHL